VGEDMTWQNGSAGTIPGRWPGRSAGAPQFGEYVIYVDESGDHGLSEINPD
jgi:hypothetical protein